MTTSAPTTVAAIERMRVQAPAQPEALTRIQLRRIVNGLLRLYPLKDIAEDAFGPFLTGGDLIGENEAVATLAALSDKDTDRTLAEARSQLRSAVTTNRLPEQHDGHGTAMFHPDHIGALAAEIRVLNVIAEHGTWLTHVNGGSNTEIINSVDEPHRPIFQAPSLIESAIRPALVRKGKKLVPFAELSAVEQAAAINLTEPQIDAIAALVEAGGEQLARDRIEEVVVSRERRAAARHTGHNPAQQRAAVKAVRKASVIIEQPALVGGNRRLRRRPVRRRRPAVAGNTRTAVRLPLGFERTAWHRRDIARAAAAIVVISPDDDTLTRYLFTKMQVSVLTFEHVTLVWFFADHGRLEEIDQVNPRNQMFNRLAVEAYDLLEIVISRRDAVEALRSLISGELNSVEEIEHACVKASWLAEADIQRVQRLLPAASERPETMRHVQRELGFLAQRVKAKPQQFLIEEIGQLNAGQVKRIAAAAGLDVDDEAHNAETEIRQTLKEYGFGSDLDRLVPAGVRAIRAGRRDEFIDVMDTRADGDTSWSEKLEELYASLGNG